MLRELYFGACRFDAIRESLGIGRNILAQRLRRFVDEGITSKQPYQHNPVRYEYRLTEKGADLVGVLLAMMRWGDRWLDRGKGPPIVLWHEPCRSHTHAEVVCGKCHRPLALAEIGGEIGPGFPKNPRLRKQLEHRLDASVRQTAARKR